jgi:TctA family transporter
MQIPSNFSAIESFIKTGGMISLLIFSMDTRLGVLSLAVPPGLPIKDRVIVMLAGFFGWSWTIGHC